MSAALPEAEDLNDSHLSANLYDPVADGQYPYTDGQYPYTDGQELVDTLSEFQGLTLDQISALTPDTLTYWGGDILSSISAAQIQKITPAALTGLSPEQLRELSQPTVRGLSNSQLAALAQSQTEMSDAGGLLAFVQDMTPSQVSAFFLRKPMRSRVNLFMNYILLSWLDCPRVRSAKYLFRALRNLGLKISAP